MKLLSTYPGNTTNNFTALHMRQSIQEWTKKICGRQPLKNLKGYGMPKADHTPSDFLKAVFHKIFLVHS